MNIIWKKTFWKLSMNKIYQVMQQAKIKKSKIVVNKNFLSSRLSNLWLLNHSKKYFAKIFLKNRRRLGRGSSELGRGSIDLGRDSVDLGRGTLKYKPSYL